ncbi:MAG TPA: hypothetical protein VIY27_10160 [Myxococcota bacterium]
MATNRAKLGAYYKGRTKRWLMADGWQVADLEVVRWIPRPGGELLPVKRDQLGSDLLAVCPDRGVVFVQAKGGETWRKNIAAARKEFWRFEFPEESQQWIVGWSPRARRPDVIVVERESEAAAAYRARREAEHADAPF